MKVVIVGGVAGGATAAARLRRLDEQAEIVVLERSGFVSYANCGLPYYIGDIIKERSKLTLQTPESFRRRFRIDVRVHHEVLSVDRAAKAVFVRNLETGEECRENYDKLILSPGAHAVVPDYPGVDGAHVFTLRTVEDTFAIRDYLDGHEVRRAAVIGGGFIGLEMAENLCERGVEVHVFQRSGHVMPVIDADMAAFLHNRMRSNGIVLHLNARILGFADADGCTLVQTADEEPMPVDMVMLSIGVAPETGLARDAGLELGLKGAIVVDEHMLTSDPDIYAVGDAVQVKQYVTGENAVISLAGPANKQGRIAADNICGRESAFTGSQASSVMKMFDMTIAATGLNDRTLSGTGIAYDSVLLSPPNHATYYPGSEPMRLKVVFEQETGRVLGAQAVGGPGVDKRIDVLATAIRARMTVRDLQELDLAYAPPYSSAKDPVNMAGYLAANILDGLVRQVTWSELPDPLGAHVLLDVRSAGERARGSVPGTIHIPVDELRDRLEELPAPEVLREAGATLFVHCQSGLRSYLACRVLSQLGYPCANVAGGYLFYQAMKTDADARDAGAGPCGM